MERDVVVNVDDGDGESDAALAVRLEMTQGAQGIFVVAQGASALFGARTRFVAARVAEELRAGVAAVQLLQAHEADDRRVLAYRFDIGRLGDRLVRALDLIHARHPELPIGVFASGTAAAAALYAAALRPDLVRCVVSRGGRPDLAEAIFPRVRAPVLIAVGGRDLEGVRAAYRALRGLPKASGVALVPSGDAELARPQDLDVLAGCTVDWLLRWLQPRRAPALKSLAADACRGGGAERSA